MRCWGLLQLQCYIRSCLSALPFLHQELNDRDRFLQVLLEKYQQASVVQGAADQQQQQQSGAMQAAAAGAAGGSKLAPGSGLPVNAVNSGPPLLLEEAVAVIIRNERGRQVRADNKLCTALCRVCSSTCVAVWARRGVHITSCCLCNCTWQHA